MNRLHKPLKRLAIKSGNKIKTTWSTDENGITNFIFDMSNVNKFIKWFDKIGIDKKVDLITQKG